MPFLFRFLALSALLVAESASGMIAGGGSEARDCWMAFEAPGRKLNFPRWPRPGREVRCFDGEAGCDVDGQVDGVCTFDADVCFHNVDPELPECTPQEVTRVVVKNANRFGGLPDLQNAIDALLPIAGPTCTSGQTLEVPLRVGASGKEKWNRERLAIRTITKKGKAIDRLRYSCIPNEWANDGFDRQNSRSKRQATRLTVENVAHLRKAWEFDLQQDFHAPPNVSIKHNVSAPPTVMDGRVFFPSANGYVYALDADTGRKEWEYEALGIGQQPSPLVPGVYSSLTLTADGRVVFGDSAGRVHVIDQRSGSLGVPGPEDGLWRTTVRETVDDHIWSSPVVANGRVFVSIASHFDDPCVPGRVLALDLDSGEVLWTTRMVPENACDNDLDRECTTDADCGLGTCVQARGAGITGVAAIDAAGENIYVNTVGCGSFPSMGHSESILKLDAATGEIVWASRMAPREQLGHCASDDSECGTDAGCPAGDVCVSHAAGPGVLGFRDFGFLAGPMLADIDDGNGGTRSLVVSAAKEGTVFALDEATGSLVWSNQVVAEPAHGGQGHFSGGMACDSGKIYAALGSFFAFPAPPFQQVALDVADGSTQWTKSYGSTYSAVGVAEGVVLSGSPPGLVAQEPSTGELLAEFPLPAWVQSAPVVVDGKVFIGWGSWLGTSGGLTAFTLD